MADRRGRDFWSSNGADNENKYHHGGMSSPPEKLC